jgi:hypothetical protein
VFGNQSEEDYRESKAERRREREDIRDIEKSFKLGIGNSLDKMMDAVMGRYHAPRLSGEPDKITAPIKPGAPTAPRRTATAQADAEYDDSQDEVPMQSYASAPARATRYGEIISELDRFRFASDPERRKKQFSVITVAIRDALQDLIVRDVAQNTKRAFKDYMGDFFKLKGGVRVVFNFDNMKKTVSARGAFYGDELIFVKRQGDKVVGGVARLVDGDAEDISDNYSITVE